MLANTLVKNNTRSLRSKKAQKSKAVQKRSYADNKNLQEEFKTALAAHLSENKFTPAEAVFEHFTQIAAPSGQWPSSASQTYFSGLYAVTKAFQSTFAEDPKAAPFTVLLDKALTNVYEETYTKPPVKVAVTGAAGAIGYALLFRIASGQLLGPNQPVILHLLELPGAMKSLGGVMMELDDCAFPLLKGIHSFDNADAAFVDVDYALLVGAMPRQKGMERKDLLSANAKIFVEQGKALNRAKASAKVLVVGNPANTNCLIASRNCNTIPATNFHAMTKLDHSRGLAQLAAKTNTQVTDIQNFAIWGNHSATQYPSIAHCSINGEDAATVINDQKWVVDNFIPTVQQRGAAIIAARGSSSAASAAGAAIASMHDLAVGTYGNWTSMGVVSKGEYGVTPGLFYSYPVVCNKGEYAIVENLPIDPFSAERMEITHKELLQELNDVAAFAK